MSEIAGRHVLITGGASGIGRLMALEAAGQGGRVSIWDINADNLDEGGRRAATRAGGERAHGFICDVARRERVYAVADETRAAAGPVDILINNAGVVSGRSLLDIPGREDRGDLRGQHAEPVLGDQGGPARHDRAAARATSSPSPPRRD